MHFTRMVVGVGQDMANEKDVGPDCLWGVGFIERVQDPAVLGTEASGKEMLQEWAQVALALP